MYHLKNITNSPYSIPLADGSTKLLPARGELESVDVHPLSIQQLRVCGYIEVTEAVAGKADKQQSKSTKNK